MWHTHTHTHPKAAHCTNLLTLWCKSPLRISKAYGFTYAIHEFPFERIFEMIGQKVYKGKAIYSVYLAPTTARHLPLNCITGFKWEIYAVACFFFWVTARAILFSFFVVTQSNRRISVALQQKKHAFTAAMTLILELRSRLYYYHHNINWTQQILEYFVFPLSIVSAVSAVQCTRILLGPIIVMRNCWGGSRTNTIKMHAHKFAHVLI